MSKYCQKCGTTNNDAAMFCTNCGATLSNKTDGNAQSSNDLFATDSSFSSDVSNSKPRKSKILVPLIAGIAAVAVIAIVLAVMLFSGSFDRMSATSKAGKGDYIGALESYEKYLSRSGKDSTEVLSQAALYALSAGDADKALMYARSVPEKSEESIRVEGRAALVLAEKAKKNEDWEKAVSILDGCSYDDAEEMLEEMRYNLGVELMSAEKWEKAAEQFSQTDYADSKDLLAKCEFAMSVDANFLSDIVTFCNGIIEAGFDADEVSSFLTALEPYSTADFKDPELQKCAAAFISDMQSYLKVLSSNNRICYKQLDMCTPLGDASSQLIRINNLYPFESKTWIDISIYFETPEYWETMAEVVQQLASDMGKKASSGYYNRDHQFIRVPNNTKYEVNATFWFYCYDKSNKLYSTDEVTVTLAKAKKTQVIFECNANFCPSWGYDFYVNSYR